MRTSGIRGRPAALPGLVLAALLGLLGVGVAPAVAIDPSAVTAIEVHKFEQPDRIGDPASGLPQDTAGLIPVAGASFTAKPVPGIDLTTSAGQAAAAALTPAEAAALVAGLPAAAQDTTDAAGNATLAPLGVGLYYVEETATPAGYVGSAPFLVALPLTDPVNRDGWLTTVHVYPKNAPVSIDLSIADADAVKLGDAVRWTARSDIPNQPEIDGYRIGLRFPSGLEVTGGASAAAVAVECGAAACPELIAGVHYTRALDAATRTLAIDFTAAGRQVLAAAVAAHPEARVVTRVDTRVLAEGEHRVRAELAASRAIIDGAPGAPGPVSDTALTKWGPLAILVHERGKPRNLIPGAKFKLFLSAEDARRGRNPITVDGADEWTTDADGSIVIHGLRFSDFVDGLEREESDPLFRFYYVILTEIPEGYSGEKHPIALTVTSTTEAEVAVVELWRDGGDDDDDGDGDDGRDDGDDGDGGDLAITGAQTTGLVLLAVLLGGVGILLVARRRERERGESAEPSGRENTEQ
ncbi:SpaH/EbpB family LPXTG-anchored major pilin [Leucobacter weissii]|uniref:SpaH/EbpB family LPXTG-anchored major pilin n=1 Tax=Leucobacter weissii TaxID=1983706 RepID=A0A939S5V6_9MICO|nr:SpaH/EbpB family LPXTG-anchored major pilin [Leucobacter weissii]MBO1901719.1 SpaH/EbpB family LPXTG-anchored major pilin [Leucobacter weissii]